jgi:hypothetical protein
MIGQKVKLVRCGAPINLGVTGTITAVFPDGNVAVKWTRPILIKFGDNGVGIVFDDETTDDKNKLKFL